VPHFRLIDTYLYSNKLWYSVLHVPAPEKWFGIFILFS